MILEKMNEFFDKRAGNYDNHMLVDLQLAEFYDAIAECFRADKNDLSLLDLGCGTGLELERLFLKMPNLSVTGVDLSQEMLNVLKEKYSSQKFNLICSSYFDIDYGSGCFDFALSTYSLHHFSQEEKLGLYRKVYNSLKNGGTFVEGDYTCDSLENQLFHINENKRLREENGITDGFYHYDTPFTKETQIMLLKAAGFSVVRIMREWENTTITIAVR